MRKLKVIISGGGTGGHIFPAIAIADALKKRFSNAEILFVGAENRMEMTRVPDAGYNIIGLPVSGFNRKNLLKNVSVLWKLRKCLSISNKILKDFNPDVVVGVGGYASGPVLKAAASKGIPTLLQEQNSYPGVTNKLLSKKASAICVAYQGMEKFFPENKIIMTGNPCRESLLNQADRDEAIKFFDLDPKLKTVLIIGGSLGAKSINNAINVNFKAIGEADVQIIWQSGKYYFHDLFLELPNRTGTEHIHLYDFINRMDLAYKVADLVISRAGASSISELSLLGKPAILIPSPNVAEDHQTKNAMALVKNNAAILVRDEKAMDELVPIMLNTIKDNDKLNTLSQNISKLAQHDSAERIVDEIIKLVSKRK